VTNDHPLEQIHKAGVSEWVSEWALWPVRTSLEVMKIHALMPVSAVNAHWLLVTVIWQFCNPLLFWWSQNLRETLPCHMLAYSLNFRKACEFVDLCCAEYLKRLNLLIIYIHQTKALSMYIILAIFLCTHLRHINGISFPKKSWKFSPSDYWYRASRHYKTGLADH